MIKIVHTADLHFGLEHGRFPTVSDKLRQERFRGLQLIVQRANDENAHAIVIAGDLFDKLTIPQKLVKEVKAALVEFKGSVFVIPGNHDWYNSSADDNKLWETFINSLGTNVYLLKDLAPFTCILNEKTVVFYPCGCHQKHSSENRIGWVGQIYKEVDKVHIGIAHGNVDGYGLDEEGNYFGMSIKELKDAEVDCWLLGHIHAPYPVGDSAGGEVFYFAGNHWQDSWKTERVGGSWLIEIDGEKRVKATRWSHKGIYFKNLNVKINNLNDIQSFLSELKHMDARQTILRLTLGGSLLEEELQEARTTITGLTDSFLYCETLWEIGLKITPEAINKLYAADSVPHTLLTKLSQSDGDQLAMQLAFETIKTITE